MRSLIFAVSVSVVGLGIAAPAQAAASGGGGLPQLDISTYSSQVIWLVITFIALYVMMNWVALPRIGEVLEERQNRIDDNLTKAEDLKTQAEAASNAYDASLAKARGQAFDAIREVKDKASAEANERQAQLTKRLSASIKDAEAGIATAKAEALSSIKEVAVDVARSAISKLTGEDANEGSVSKAVSSALKDRA